MIQTNELIKSIQDSLFQWYDFPQGSDIYIYDKKTLPLQKGKNMISFFPKQIWKHMRIQRIY